jgi:choline/ethanolamine kinase
MRLAGIRHVIETIRHSPERVENADDAIRIVHALVKSWSSLDISCSTAIPVPGGITNRIFRVTSSACDPPVSALVRIFGAQGVISLSARANENRIFAQLAAANSAPDLLGVFANGRVEQWLPARSITLDEMRDPHVMQGVAKAMAKLHAVMCQADGDIGPVTTWDTIDGWLNMGRGLKITKDEFDTDTLARELSILRAVIAEPSPPSPVSPVVFCHNDLLNGNIMIGDAEDRVVSLIDFEYSAANYRGFDIGNYFAEAMGGTDDGIVKPSKYPTPESQSMFCRTYLTCMAEQAVSTAADGLISDDGSISVEGSTSLSMQPLEEQVTHLVREANHHSLLAHLYWSTWALAQSKSSTVDFPYLLFARQKLAEYLRVKDVYLIMPTDPAALTRLRYYAWHYGGNGIGPKAGPDDSSDQASNKVD